LARPSTIPRLYFNEIASQERDDEITKTARQIVSLCVTLKELPYIRYYKSGKQSQVNHRIAIEVEVRSFICLCLRSPTYRGGGGGGLL
jgi:hypothetical protein